MRALRVVEHEEPVQRPLQSRGRAEVVPTKRNAPVFMQNRALQALHESVGPRMPRLRPRVAHLVVGTGGDEAGFELLAVVGQHARQAPAGSPIAVQGRTPRRLVTDKLRSYAAAHRTVMPSIVHSSVATVREQPSRGLTSTDTATRGPDATVQIRRARATFLIGARSRAESVSGRSTPAAGGSLPPASNTGVRRMGCGDLRLLNGRAHRCVEAGKRAGLVKLTEPRAVLLYQLE